MKIITLTLAVLLIGVVLLSGCIENKKDEFANMKDCGTDLKCFQDSLMKCEPVKVATEQEFNGYKVSLFSAVKGGTVSNCTVFSRIDEASVPENASLEQKAGAFLLKGKYAECSAPVELVKEDLSSIDYEKYCHGSLVDLIKTASKIQPNS